MGTQASAAEVGAYRDWVRVELSKAGGTCTGEYLRSKLSSSPNREALAIAGGHFIFPTVRPSASQIVAPAPIDYMRKLQVLLKV